jgi:hypothetical protein
MHFDQAHRDKDGGASGDLAVGHLVISASPERPWRQAARSASPAFDLER